MKQLGVLVILVVGLATAGCHPGGEQGDPNVGAGNAGPASSTTDLSKRPGLPGGPALKPTPTHDAMGGRSGAAAGQ